MTNEFDDVYLILIELINLNYKVYRLWSSNQKRKKNLVSKHNNIHKRTIIITPQINTTIIFTSICAAYKKYIYCSHFEARRNQNVCTIAS